MHRNTLTYTGHWIAGLNGAAIVSILIGTLAEPQDQGYFAALYQQLLNVRAFDFGTSSISGLSALETMLVALVKSSEIVLPASAIALLFGVLTAAALTWRGTRSFATPLFYAIASIPLFCASLLAIVIFSPSLLDGGTGAQASSAHLGFGFASPLTWVVGLAVAGAIALALSRAAKIALAEPYMENMQRFGLSRGQIIRNYALRHILALTLRDVGGIVLALYTAVVVAEWVFAWPGAGSLFLRSVALEDWRVVAVFVLGLASLRFTAEFFGALAARTLMGARPAR